MSGLAWAGLGLVLVGAWAGTPGLLLVGSLGLLVEGSRAVWARFGLGGLEYERHLATDRAVCGDVIALDLTVRNRKALPLAWLRAVDLVSDGVTVRERDTVPTERAGQLALANAWSLAGFERVVRHYHVLANRRGVYALGPVRLTVSDVFARSAASRELPGRARYLVRPRMVSLRMADAPRAWLGPQPARRGLLEQSQLFAGIRPYQPGDPLRSVHWPSTARTGRPQVKRYDPALQHEVLIALDIATPASDLAVGSFDDDLVEGLCVAAASLARHLLADEVACGLAVAAFTGVVRRFAYLPPGSGPRQLGRLGDLLARLSSVPSAPFEELLSGLPTVLRPGATVLVLSSRDPTRRLATERRLGRLGFAVQHVAFGPRAAEAARRARSAGVAAFVARLEPDWQTGEALEVAG